MLLTLLPATAFAAGTAEDEVPLAITVGDRAVGGIGAFRQGNIHFRTAELGYYIAPHLWGRGLASSAVKQLCSHIFQNTDILRIFAEPFAENIASCRVLEKAGFQLEGVLHSNAVKNGVVRDMKLYALIRGLELKKGVSTCRLPK